MGRDGAGHGTAGLALALSAVAFAAAIAWFALSGGGGGARAGTRLVLYCAAGIQPPVETIAREYEGRYGVAVDVRYGGSGTLLAALEVAPEGDLFLAGDSSFVDRAREKGLVAERLPLAVMRPVIGVARGNPKGVRALADLARVDVACGLADPDAAAVGRVSRRALEEAGLWETARLRVKVFKPTVGELANDLVLGALDAAVIWDATAARYPEIEVVRAPELDALPREVTVGVLAASRQPTEALRFARYLSARDAGLEVFRAHGFVPVSGDRWAEVPEVVLMGGAMLSAAVDGTIREFEEREGARVDRVYNGCGILVAQMRAGARPDAYFSCDVSFLDAVADRFLEGTVFSRNDLVILVQPGNPHGIRGLSDLARPGLRVGVGHPESSALGALTQRLLERDGLDGRLRASARVVDSATGDLLVNQARTGSLDAAVVYRSNAAKAAGLELVSVEAEGAFARQPFAVARGTDHPRLLERLGDALRAGTSRSRFEALGFAWELEDE